MYYDPTLDKKTEAKRNCLDDCPQLHTLEPSLQTLSMKESLLIENT